MIYLFWLSILILVYHIFGYGLLLSFIVLFKKKVNTTELIEFPTITVLCPAYNEESVIEEKIKSFLNIDYPKDKIEMIIISDDSTDNTNKIVQKYLKNNNINLVVQKPRKGKQSGHNLVEPSIDTEYVLSTDANSIFKPDAVLQLLKVMESDERIGMVSGELRLISSTGQDSGEGMYWKYESFLKKCESKLYSIIGANGSIFLIKRELFTQIEAASVDDFERTLITLKNGYKAKYAPEAVVLEDVSIHASEEIGRKIRIIAQEWFAIGRQKKVFINPIVAFMLISHKVIRWIFPLFSMVILLSSGILIRIPIFLVIFILQIITYLLGTYSLLHKQRSKKTNKICNISAYITAMNYSAIAAFIQFLNGKQYATWNTIREEK